MSEFIEKKLRVAKAFSIYLLVLLVLTVGSAVASSFVSEAGIVILFSANALWFSCVMYCVHYMPFVRSVKWLKTNNMENITDDIILETPTLPRSKIYCGRRALFSKKPCVILPYSEIAWVNLYERSAYGIAVEKAVIVHTKDGRKISLKSNATEFQWLLDHHIIPNSPNIVIGYGHEQEEKYKQLNPQSVQERKRVKRVWGIALMCVGATLLIA